MPALSEFPVKAEPLVRGDPWSAAFLMHTVTDSGRDYTIPDDWSARAHIRRHPDGELITEFTVEVSRVADGGGIEIPIDDTPTVVDAVLLSLTAEQSTLVRYGDGFDLEQITPARRTILTVESLRVAKDYSHA